MKFDIQVFGNRCWGASFVLWYLSFINSDYHYLVKIASSLVFAYFVWFGAERFTPGYRKTL